jgi:hypothetical protein
MPIPNPKDNEKQNKYMGRCMEFMKEEKYPQKQKVAICLNTFQNPKKKSKANEMEIDITETEAYQKTYKGKKRSTLKDSDFLFPEDRSFPIVSPQDVRDAISNFGRMKKAISYDTFIKKLYNKAKSKGPESVAAIPDSIKKEHKLN